MSSRLKNDEPFLARGDITGLAEPGAALMPGSMTPVPLSSSVWVRTTHDISQITHGALMQTLPSLSCAHSCIAFVIPPHINRGSPQWARFLWQQLRVFIHLQNWSFILWHALYQWWIPVWTHCEKPNQSIPLTAHLNINVPAKNHHLSIMVPSCRLATFV